MQSLNGNISERGRPARWLYTGNITEMISDIQIYRSLTCVRDTSIKTCIFYHSRALDDISEFSFSKIRKQLNATILNATQCNAMQHISFSSDTVLSTK